MKTRILTAVLLCITLLFSLKQSQAQCHIDDWTALKGLYESTDGDNWTNKAGWEQVKAETQPKNCNLGELYGIHLDAIGRVSCIDLDDKPNCQIDDFATMGNNLVGYIPAELSYLSNLTFISLVFNKLNGDIPPEIGNLINLIDLHLGANELSGNIPTELGKLINLERLDLDINKLSGNLPIQLGNLSKIRDLWLSNNKLSGSIPSELGNLNKLIKLRLHNNQLSGNIPPELGNLNNLTIFRLNNNQLNGGIPPELGNLKKLHFLDLSSNNLSGTIPIELENLDSLYYLHLSFNSLDGNIPPGLGGISQLKELYINNNELTGNIPPELGNLSSLIELDLSYNQLSGFIPGEISYLSNLEQLFLNKNNLSGCFHENLVTLCDQLLSESISGGNGFEASWKRFCDIGTAACDNSCHLNDWTALKALYENTNGDNWYNNRGWEIVKGESPPSNCNLEYFYGVTIDENNGRVTNLSLSNNNLTGDIPTEIDALTKLNVLYLRDNQLNGNLPSNIGNLGNLKYLDLHGNNLSGSLPPELGNLTELTTMNLSKNNFSNNIPSKLTDLNNLQTLDLWDNQLSGNVPSKLSNLNILSINHNYFSCEDIDSIFNSDQQIQIFNYTPQYFKPISYDSIKSNVFDTLTINQSFELDFEFPFETAGFSYQWYRNGNIIPEATQPILTLDTIQPNNVGKYVLRLESENCLPFGNIFETISEPIFVILKGYDYNGQPVEYDQVMVRFDNEEVRKYYETTILDEYAGIRADKCDCNRELHLWQFPDTEKATKALIDLNQKVVKVKPVTEVDGGFNNILNMNPVNSKGLAHLIKIPHLNANANDPVSVYILDSGLDKQNYNASPYLFNPAPIDSCYDLNSSGYGYVSNFLEVDDETITISTNYTDAIGHGTFGFRSIADSLPQNSNIKIVPLQITKSYDRGTLFDLLCGLYHAIDHNADIVNISAGFKGSPNPVFERAINEAREKGIFVVASAGNDSINIDQTPQYPAYYASQYHKFETTGGPGEIPQLDSIKYDHIISVAAINTKAELYPYSNYGKESVVLSAPGENIAGYSLNGELDVFSGTSMATFFTTLGLALEYSADNQRPYKTILQDFKQHYLEDNPITDSLTQTGKQLKFSSTVAMIEGCTDCTACNYKPFANIEDNASCIYCIDDRETIIKLDCPKDAPCPPCNDQFGCMDPAACNYNPEATTNNGSCSYDCEENLDLVECPGEKRVNVCAPVNIPPALALADFSTGSNVVLSSQPSFNVDQQTILHPNYTTTTYTYTFTSGSDNQQSCTQSYHIANQFLQAPEISDPPFVCQDDLWSYVKLGTGKYKIYADDNGTKGTELTTCDTPGLHCSTSSLEVNTTISGMRQFWVTEFFAFPDGTICESDASPFSLEIYPKPIASLSAQSITIAAGQGIALMDVINDNTTGYWTGENIIHLLTADGENIPYFSSNEVGLYKLYYTVENELCQNSYLLVVEVSNGAKIEDKPIGGSQVDYRVSNEQQWHIYPNPANRQVQIEWIGGKTDTNTLRLLDLTGKVLLQNTFEGEHFTFDVSGLAKGMYLIEVQNGKGTSVQKLLVE